MQISVTEAKAQLTELIRRAEAGDEIILTRHGQAAVKLVPMVKAIDRATKRKALDAIRSEAAKKVRPGDMAGRSQDFLYEDNGLPK